MLRDIRELLKERGPMELRDLALHFEAETSAMQGMLEFLETRGQVKHTVVSCGSGSSGGCPGCGDLQPERQSAATAPGGITFWSLAETS